MIAVNIEKEIKRENRVIGKFTVRQVAFIIGALAVVGLFYFIARPTISTSMGIGMICGVIAWYFGFHKKNGLPIEYFWWKKIKTAILMNFKRPYRTRNAYITMLNNAYNADKMADMQDKKKAKALQRREKKKATKKTRLRAYN